MFMDNMRKQTHQCAQYKLKKIIYKTWQQKDSGKHVVEKYKSGFQFCWHAISSLQTAYVDTWDDKKVMTQQWWHRNEKKYKKI